MLIGFDVARLSGWRAGRQKKAQGSPNWPLLKSDQFQRNAVRFGSETPSPATTPQKPAATLPQPANLIPLQMTKLQEILPEWMGKKLFQHMKPHRQNWVHIRLNEGHAAALVYLDGGTLKETNLGGSSRLLKAAEVAVIRAKLEKAFDGPEAETNRAALKRAIQFPEDITEVPLRTEPTDLTQFQATKLHELLPAVMTHNLEKTLKNHKRTWVRLKMEVGKLPVIVYKDGDQLKEANFVGTARPLKADELAKLHARLQTGFDGPDSRNHLLKLKSILEFVDLPGIMEQAKAEEIERRKLKGDAVTYLVSLFPFKFQSGLLQYMQHGQNGIIQKIRATRGFPLQVRLEGSAIANELKTPKFTQEDLETLRRNVTEATELLERSHGKREDEDVNVKGPLKSVLKLLDIDAPVGQKPVEEVVPQVPVAEPASLEETDLPILAELLPGKLGQVLDKIPDAFRQHLHSIKVTVNQPIQIFRKGEVIATGATPVSLAELNQIENTLEGLQTRPQKAEADDPAAFRRAYVRLRALIDFDRVLKSVPNADLVLPDPTVKVMQQEDLEKLLEVLPPMLKSEIEALSPLVRGRLEEIELNLNRPPVLRAGDEVIDAQSITSAADLKYIMERVGKLGPKERAGLTGTLHRISPMTNPGTGNYTGMTIRVGRVVDADISPIVGDLNAGKSLLLLGAPGFGKTTLLRKMSRHLSLQTMLGGKPMGGSVVVVDTSNEIGGDGDEPHRFLGRARRLQVPSEEKQYEVMRRAIQNHRARVVVIDEIGSVEEAEAASIISRNGGMLLATAHGNDFAQLIENDALKHLVGNPREVTIGDEMMQNKGLTKKTQRERATKPPFDTLMVMKSRFLAEYFPDFPKAIDDLLSGKLPKPMQIHFNKNG